MIQTFPGHAPNSVISTVQRLFWKGHTEVQSHRWKAGAQFYGTIAFEINIWPGHTWADCRGPFTTDCVVFCHTSGIRRRHHPQMQTSHREQYKKKKKHYCHSHLNIKRTRGTQSKLLFTDTLTKRSTGSRVNTSGGLTVIRSMATGSTPTGRCHESVHNQSMWRMPTSDIWRVNTSMLLLVQSCLWVNKATHGINEAMASVSRRIIACVFCIL